jgi:hypothetical protein
MIRVPDEGYSRNTSCPLNYVVFQSLDDTCTWWRLFHKHVMPTKLCGLARRVSGITFIRYTYHLKIEKPHNLVLTTCLWNNLHQVPASSKMMRVPDEGYSTNTSWVLNYLVFQSLDDACTWWRLFHKHVVPTKLCGFSIFRWCVYLMKVIPQTRRAPFIRYTHHLKIEKPNNLVGTTCLWNNLHQVHASSKDWRRAH